MGLINVTGVSRRRHGNYEEPESSRRQATHFFTLPNGQGEILQVCRATFMDVHGIHKSTIATLVKAKKKVILFTRNRGATKRKIESML